MKVQQTESWNSVADNWFCPGCLRRKPECEVSTKAGDTLRCLFEHHDHMRDYVKDYLVERHGEWHAIGKSHPHPSEFFRYIDLIKLLVQRFPHTLVCIDCNEAEAKIKKSVGCDKYFSFHPVELHRAIVPAKNQRHLFVPENMSFYEQLYAKTCERLVVKRKEVARSLVDAAIATNAWWGGPIQMEKLFSEETLGREFHSFDSSKRIKQALEAGKPVYRGAAWYPQEEAELRRMLAAGTDIKLIARSLGRTPGGVRFRMERLGLSESRSSD